MDEREHARREARKQHDRKRAAALAELGILPAEASLFHVIQFGLTVPPDDVCRRATYPDYTIGWPLTVEQTQAALAGCLAKGWLQIIDEAALEAIQEEVRREGLIGPVYRFPLPGGVDFTHAGAEQWRRVCARPSNRVDDSWCCDVVHEKTAHYFRSKSVAMAEWDKWKQCDEVVAVNGPTTIGPWRAQWWRRFDEGYRIDVEQRMQWSGGCAEGRWNIFLLAVHSKLDLARARDVLIRQGVARTEWLILSSLEDSNNARWIVRRARRFADTLGWKVTEADCSRALESCLLRGWLREIDDTAIAEIRDLLRCDTAVMPVPYQPADESSALDLSEAGAQVYRRISEEILGADWEDRLRVEDTFYREAHFYCTTDTALQYARNSNGDSCRIPSSSRTVAIGPWCVYWWKRFASGYRMELTFGEP